MYTWFDIVLLQTRLQPSVTRLSYALGSIPLIFFIVVV